MKTLLLTLTLVSLSASPVLSAIGIIDWGAYEQWLDEPPQLVTTRALDEQTLALLEKHVALSESVLFPEAAPAPAGETDELAAVRREIAERVANFPKPLRLSRSSQWNPTVVHRSGSSTGTEIDTSSGNETSPELYRRYERLGRNLNPAHIGNALNQFRTRIDRDIRDIDRELERPNPGRHPSATAAQRRQAQVDKEWLRDLRKWIDGFEPLLARRAALEQAPASSGPDPRAEWAAFAERDLPVLRRVIAAQLIDRHPLDEHTGRYSHPPAPHTLIHFRIGGRDLYYPLDGDHNFRTFDTR